MEATVFDCKKQEGYSSFYYPHYYTEWMVTYRSIYGHRKEKVTTMTDSVRGGSGIANELPYLRKEDIIESDVMEEKITEQASIEEAFETLRRHYLYRAKSWSVPTIELLASQWVYIPYQLIEKTGRFSKKTKTYLFEPMSNSLDKIDKFPEIYKFIEGKVGKI
ncbi:hypothetical protein [Natribacillus halophilus]|nr:hypothetical protein [Natribacillus halophilus]